MQDGLKAANANVVFFDGITAGEKDFSALIARLKKENIDFVYYGGYYPDGRCRARPVPFGPKLSLWGRKAWVTLCAEYCW